LSEITIPVLHVELGAEDYMLIILNHLCYFMNFVMKFLMGKLSALIATKKLVVLEEN